MLVRLNSSSEHYLRDIYHPDDLPFTLEQWIEQSIVNQCLAEQLLNLTNQFDLLEEYYQSK